jgi:VWFA-related protein
VRASAGLGALQDFTQDRRMLLAAAEQVRWNPRGGGEMNAYTPVRDALAATSAGQAYMYQENDIDRVMRFTLLATGSLRRLVHGMASLPGRKSVVVLSDHMPLATPDELTSPGDSSNATGTGMFGGPILSSMRRVVDESTRSGVALYAIDTRGINSLVSTAADQYQLPLGATESVQGAPTSSSVPNTANNAAQPYDDSTRLKIEQKMQGRRDEHIENQWGGIFLTSQTGGFMVTESNRIDAGLERIVNDQQGYYVLGFTPAADVLEPDENGDRVYHRVKVEVLRPGLKVRTHSGFFGISDEDATRAEREQRPELIGALESPFQSQGVGVEVRAAFLNAKKNQAFLRTEVTIDGRTLKLTGPPNHLTGVIHLLARAFAVNGEQLVGGIDQHLRVDLNAEGYQRALKYGLVYTTLIEVPKPGPYQMRVACSDESTGKIGTASDFVDVPQIKGRYVVLSGLVFAGDRGDYDVVVPALGPAYFTPGQKAAFAFQVLHAPGAASVKGGAGDRGLTVRTRLFRDAEQISETPAVPVATDAKKSASQFFTRGEIDIPAGLAPGEYLLRVDVENPTAKKPQLAWRWARLTVRGGA